MNKIVKILFIIFLLNGCGYQPTLLKKNYDFSFANINSEGDSVINNIIKNYLLERSHDESTKKFDLYISSKSDKKIVSSNKKGDPNIFKLIVTVDYNLKQSGEIIFKNKILKQTTYNNINDKFELLKYEDKIMKDLSESFANDILISATVIRK